MLEVRAEADWTYQTSRPGETLASLDSGRVVSGAVEGAGLGLGV